MTVRFRLLALAMFLAAPVTTWAQDQTWIADFSVGWAGFVDDATKHYLLVGGGVRRYLSPRVSIGPEIVVMSNGDELRDRNVLLTGNVVFDMKARAPVTPFLVAGGGIFWGRDQVRTGPYWSSDPAFTGGGGVRALVSDAVSVAAEYRVGWELHQRLSGAASVRW